MYDMKLYDAMLIRKSVRKYRNKEVDAKVMDDIRNHIATLKPLYDDISIKMIMIDSSEFEEYFESSSLIHAPHYITITSQNERYFGENVGFMGENLIVFLTSLGLGSCWVGTLKSKESAFELPYVITITFGYADDELYRESLVKINRKSLEQICLVKPQNDFMNELYKQYELLHLELTDSLGGLNRITTPYIFTVSNRLFLRL
jgi:nitroreductase